MTEPHMCTLPYNVADFGEGWEHACVDCGRSWVLKKRNGVMGWTLADREIRAEEVARLMHELAHEEINPAVIHALMGVMANAVAAIGNIVYSSHGPAASSVLMGAWNLFTTSVHPYYLPEPCQHHSWDDHGQDADPDTRSPAKDGGEAGD